MNPNSQYDYLIKRLKNLPQGSSHQYNGIVFRFVNPKFSSKSQIIEGKGAQSTCGRWHPKGTFNCLYTSTTPETALQEALSEKRYYGLGDYKSLPRSLVAIKLDLFHLLDLTDGKTRQRLRISKKSILECDWRDKNDFENQESITQVLGRAIHDTGYEGLIAPSSVNKVKGTNIVAFPNKAFRSNSIIVQTPIEF